MNREKLIMLGLLAVAAVLIFYAAMVKGQSLFFVGNFSPSPPLSGTSVVQSNSSVNSNCHQTGSSGNYTCTLPSPITAGNTLIVVEFLFSATPGTSVVPTVTGATFIKDCAPRQTSNGGVDFYSAPISSGGATVVTINPPVSSGIASAVVAEIHGLASSLPFDTCTATPNAGTNNVWSSGLPLASNQTDFAIGAVWNRAAPSSGFSVLGNWITFGDSPQSSDGDEGFAEYINNGVQSQFTALGAVSTAHTQWTAAALYKSANAGTAATIMPTGLTDMSAGTSGANASASLMTASSFGGNGIWTSTATNPAVLQFDNAVAPTNSTTLSVNGLSKPMSVSTLSLSTDLSLVSHTDESMMLSFDPNAACGQSFSFGAYFQMSGISVTPGNGWNSFGIFAASGGTDRFIINVNTGNPPTTNLETLTGDSSTINISNGTLYWVTGLWDSTVPLSSLRYYQASTFTQVGSTMTHAINSGDRVGNLHLGQIGTEGTATPASKWWWNKFIYDCTGTFPLLPHT